MNVSFEEKLAETEFGTLDSPNTEAGELLFKILNQTGVCIIEPRAPFVPKAQEVAAKRAIFEAFDKKTRLDDAFKLEQKGSYQAIGTSSHRQHWESVRSKNGINHDPKEIVRVFQEISDKNVTLTPRSDRLMTVDNYCPIGEVRTKHSIVAESLDVARTLIFSMLQWLGLSKEEFDDQLEQFAVADIYSTSESTLQHLHCDWVPGDDSKIEDVVDTPPRLNTKKNRKKAMNEKTIKMPTNTSWLPYYRFWKRTGLTPLSFLYFGDGGKFGWFPVTTEYMFKELLKNRGGLDSNNIGMSKVNWLTLFIILFSFFNGFILFILAETVKDKAGVLWRSRSDSA